jgi:uncharacterized protein YaeQ
MRTLHVELSDVDRGIYETLELRVAQHPSESLRYLWSRILGYCLSYEEGIQFSKGGLSSADEPPLAIRGADGTLEAWIDVGAPSAERLHKASKAARRVVVYSSASIDGLRKEAARRAVHRLEAIEIWSLPPSLLDALAERTERTMSLELVRTENQVYATLNGVVFEGRVSLNRLLVEP